MTRKELEALGLEKEQIDKIMDMNGKVINTYKKEVEDLTEQFTKVKEELETKKEVIPELEEKSSASEDLTKQLEELKSQFESYKQESQTKEQQLKLQRALDLSIAKSGTVDEVALKAHLKLDDLELNEEGKLDGIDEQLEKLKEERSYLFESKLNNGLPINKKVEPTQDEEIKKAMGIK